MFSRFLLFLTVLAACYPAASHPALPVEHFPVGTVLVAHHGGRTYFATSHTLRVKETGARFVLPGPDDADAPEAVSFSPDGRRLILKTWYDAFVLRASDLRLLRRLPETDAWWEGGRLGFFDGYNGVLLLGGRRRSQEVGRTWIVAPDLNGRYFLASREVKPPTLQNASTPTNQLQLWGKTAGGRLRLLRRLVEVTYDPVSSGDPRQLAVRDRNTFVFGYPPLGVGEYDLSGVVYGGHVVAPLEDRRGRLLQNVQEPLVAGDAIVGLAEAMLGFNHGTGVRYLYRVTVKGVSLRRVPANVVLVTYDPKWGVGVGVADKTGVAVRYGVVWP